MPILRHEETRHRTLRPNHRSQDALHLDRQMPWMSERRLDHYPGRQHQNRDPRMEPIRQRRMAQTPGGNEMRKQHASHSPSPSYAWRSPDAGARRSLYSGYKRGGLSCDWRHVSGADKEPAR